MTCGVDHFDRRGLVGPEVRGNSPRASAVNEPEARADHLGIEGSLLPGPDFGCGLCWTPRLLAAAVTLNVRSCAQSRRVRPRWRR